MELKDNEQAIRELAPPPVINPASSTAPASGKRVLWDWAKAEIDRIEATAAAFSGENETADNAMSGEELERYQELQDARKRKDYGKLEELRARTESVSEPVQPAAENSREFSSAPRPATGQNLSSRDIDGIISSIKPEAMTKEIAEIGKPGDVTAKREAANQQLNKLANKEFTGVEGEKIRWAPADGETWESYLTHLYSRAERFAQTRPHVWKTTPFAFACLYRIGKSFGTRV